MTDSNSMLSQSPELPRLDSIFLPFAYERQKKVVQEQSRFVHYTGITAAKGILDSNGVWLRNVDCMNDFMEVEYGLELLAAASEGPIGKRLKKKFDTLHADFSDQFQDLFNSWSRTFRRQTYIFSMSEHRTKEDQLGRLSMWRAYGSDTRLAIVMKSTPFVEVNDALNVYSSPVAYLDQDQHAAHFEEFASTIEANADTVDALSRGDLMARLFRAFRFAALCTKHPGFEEEAEWRIIYTHDLDNPDRLRPSIQIVNGVPQKVYSIPLENLPDEGLVGITIPEILDRIIVGPTEHPVPVKDAIAQMLTDAGVEDAASKVIVSDIPLR